MAKTIKYLEEARINASSFHSNKTASDVIPTEYTRFQGRSKLLRFPGKLYAVPFSFMKSSHFSFNILYNNVLYGLY